VRIRHLLIGLLLCLCQNAVHSAEPARLLAGFQQTRVVVISEAAPCVLFDVWVAATPAERAKGLMFIESLEPHEGMIFFYQQSIDVAMWMKNTLIPLDMLFIRSNQTVARIEANTTPLSERSIYSGEPVQMVLELAGGATTRWNIQADATVWFIDRQAEPPALTTL